MIAIIEKYPTSVDYSKQFNFQFERLSLVDRKMSKVLVKDITLELDEDDYEYIILVGAEPLKYILKRSGISDIQGTLINDKYLPIANPAMLAFKPEAKPGIEQAVLSINNIVTNGAPEEVPVDITTLQDTQQILDQLRLLFKEANTYIAVDTETTSLYPRDGYILGISLTWKDHQGIYFDCDYITEEVEGALQIVFNKFTCIFHNAKFDMKWLMYHFGFNFPKWEDTMLMHYALDERTGTHGLKQLALKYTDLGEYDKALDTFKAEYCRKHKVKKADFSYSLIPFDVLSKYAAIDTLVTFSLFIDFKEKLSADQQLQSVYVNILKPGTLFILQMEETGVPFDVVRLETAQVELDKHILELESKLYTYDEIRIIEERNNTKFNFNSTQQLRVLFFDMLGLKPLKKTDTGAWSTDAETLEALANEHEIPKLVAEVRKLKKVKSTYIDKILRGLDSDSRLRTGFGLTTTTSGRLSSSGKLNMQQLPRSGVGKRLVKGAIKARKGYKIVSVDLGTAEMYIAGAISKDTTLMKMFQSGEDYHGAMAVAKFNLPCSANEVASLFPEKRQEAKTISFEILYKLNLREEALKKFPILKSWLLSSIKTIKQTGIINGPFGRKRRLRNIDSSDDAVVSHEIRSGINSVFQGAASDVNLLGAIDTQNWVNSSGYQEDILIFALVHDSILAEVREDLIDEYSYKITEFHKRDRELTIPGSPIKVDLEIGEDYSFSE